MCKEYVKREKGKIPTAETVGVKRPAMAAIPEIPGQRNVCEVAWVHHLLSWLFERGLSAHRIPPRLRDAVVWPNPIHDSLWASFPHDLLLGKFP